MPSPAPQPTRIDKHSSTEMLLGWGTGDSYALSFQELRYECPCAVCVDEHSGARVITRDQVAQDIKPTGVNLIGRYAIQINWSDGHSTGMYHFDRLYVLCHEKGQKLSGAGA